MLLTCTMCLGPFPLSEASRPLGCLSASLVLPRIIEEHLCFCVIIDGQQRERGGVLTLVLSVKHFTNKPSTSHNPLLDRLPYSFSLVLQ